MLHRSLTFILLLLLLLLVSCQGEESAAHPRGWNRRNQAVDLSPSALYAPPSEIKADFSKPDTAEDPRGVRDLTQAGLLAHHHEMCLNNANKPAHSVNRADNSLSPEELRKDIAFLPNTTFWMNEYLHVGHMTYDLVLLELLARGKVDRVVVQRAGCYQTLCYGIGTFQSFFKGLFLFALEAFAPGVNSIETYSSEEGKGNNNRPKLVIPMYFRWGWREREVKPIFLSAQHVEKDFENNALHGHFPPIPLHHRMCFEDVYRRNGHNFYGALSPSTVQRFKATAYKITNEYIKRHDVMVPSSFLLAFRSREKAMTTTTRDNSNNKMSLSEANRDRVSLKGCENFLSSKLTQPPLQILLAYRGPGASRFLSNMDELFSHLSEAFPSPRYLVHGLNTSDNTLTFQQQVATIASVHVVITNHGAYESNLIYMQNSSLLIEIGGDYDNNEFYTYQKLARMFGVFYGRVHVANLTSHDDRIGRMNKEEMVIISDMVKGYFTNSIANLR